MHSFVHWYLSPPIAYRVSKLTKYYLLYMHINRRYDQQVRGSSRSAPAVHFGVEDETAFPNSFSTNIYVSIVYIFYYFFRKAQRNTLLNENNWNSKLVYLYLSTNLCIYLSTYLSVHPSIYISISISIHLYIYQFIYLYIFMYLFFSLYL